MCGGENLTYGGVSGCSVGAPMASRKRLPPMPPPTHVACGWGWAGRGYTPTPPTPPLPPYSPCRCGAGTGLGRGACLYVVTVSFHVLSEGIQRGSHACAWSTGGASARALSGTPAVH